MGKDKVHQILEKGENRRRFNLVFDYTIMTLILGSVISIALETMPSVYSKHKAFIDGFNLFTIVVFTMEYLLRIYISDITHPAKNRFRSILKFMLSRFGLIDLLAILPFYLPMILVLDLRFIRALRLMRFLRILKLNRYNNALNLIWTVVREKKSELAATGFVTFITLLLASFIMYYVEGSHQPEAFPNIFASFWWAIATLTTVGYGDVYPITAMGKVISGIIALLGIGIVALPTGIISAGFMNKIEEVKSQKQTKTCPHCGEEIVNGE